MSAEHFIAFAAAMTAAGVVITWLCLIHAERDSRTPRDDGDRIHREWLEMQKRKKQKSAGRLKE